MGRTCRVRPGTTALQYPAYPATLSHPAGATHGGCRQCRFDKPGSTVDFAEIEFSRFPTIEVDTMNRSQPAFLLFVLFCLAASAASTADADDGEVRREVRRLVEQLDSDRFVDRKAATDRLRDLVARPALGKVLAQEFERILLRTETSFEVRKHLERLSRDLPPAEPEPGGEVSADEIERLVTQLEDDSFAKRMGAAKRIDWVLNDPRMARPVYASLKRRLGERELPADAPTWLEPVAERARGVWLATDPRREDLPPVADDRIDRWIDDLARPILETDTRAVRRGRWIAERELKDLLAGEKYVSQVKRLLESRLAGDTIEPQAAARLKALLELTRPAMVAEFWEGGRHGGTQHLLIGVPIQYAQGISCFDKIDDRVAHCASGVNLTPGDYPVGVAVPHPVRETALFHLVNLPTPRRRMAYEYRSKTDESLRLAAISRRTFKWMLDRKRPLSEAELVMLEHLDAEELSRFAGDFFNAVEDRPLPREGKLRSAGRPSRHCVICALLARSGTREVIPGLLKAIDEGRFLPSVADSKYNFPAMAALAIAARDPWPQVDSWLADRVKRSDPLLLDRDRGLELGATAAGVLLNRHRQTPSDFGLEPLANRFFLDVNLLGYRFSDERSRERIVKWWQDRAETEPE